MTEEFFLLTRIPTDQLPSLVTPKTLGTGPGDPKKNYSNFNHVEDMLC